MENLHCGQSIFRVRWTGVIGHRRGEFRKHGADSVTYPDLPLSVAGESWVYDCMLFLDTIWSIAENKYIQDLNGLEGTENTLVHRKRQVPKIADQICEVTGANPGATIVFKSAHTINFYAVSLSLENASDGGARFSIQLIPYQPKGQRQRTAIKYPTDQSERFA